MDISATLEKLTRLAIKKELSLDEPEKVAALDEEFAALYDELIEEISPKKLGDLLPRYDQELRLLKEAVARLPMQKPVQVKKRATKAYQSQQKKRTP